MTIRRIDPDFEEYRPKVSRIRGRMFLRGGPSLAGLLAGLNAVGSLQTPPPGPRRPPALAPMIVPAPIPSAPGLMGPGGTAPPR